MLSDVQPRQSEFESLSTLTGLETSARSHVQLLERSKALQLSFQQHGRTFMNVLRHAH
jgi:hypothetical protein